MPLAWGLYNAKIVPWLPAAMLALSACSSPCVELAEAICRCEPSRAAQQACIQRVNNESEATTISDAENERCATLLQECKPVCEKIDDGEFAACGLAKESLEGD